MELIKIQFEKIALLSTKQHENVSLSNLQMRNAIKGLFGWKGYWHIFSRLEKFDAIFQRKILCGLLITSFVFVMGCVNTRHSQIDEINFVDWEEIKIFNIKDKIPEHIHITDISFHGPTNERSHADVYNILKKKIAKTGGNAAIILKEAPPIEKKKSRSFTEELILWSFLFDPATAISLASSFSTISSEDHPHGKAAVIHVYSFE